MAAVRRVWSVWRGFPSVGVRQYAVASNGNFTAKPPVQLFGVEGRYAHALYSAAYKKKQVAQVETELKKFENMMSEHEKLSSFLKDPTLNKRQKSAAIKAVLGDLKYSDVTVNLFSTLIENNRLSRAEGVVKAFHSIMSACRGEVTCVVTSAKPVSDANKDELKRVLQKFLEKNQVLSLEVKTDPSLIGGIMVDLGDKFIDMSTKTKIRNMMTELRKTI